MVPWNDSNVVATVGIGAFVVLPCVYVHAPVSRLVYRHVRRHVHGHVGTGMCVDMCMDMWAQVREKIRLDALSATYVSTHVYGTQVRVLLSFEAHGSDHTAPIAFLLSTR